MIFFSNIRTVALEKLKFPFVHETCHKNPASGFCEVNQLMVSLIKLFFLELKKICD